MSKELFFIGYLMLLFSCSSEVDGIERDRLVGCDQSEEYAYLTHYPSDQICNSDTCNTYFDLWESLFLSKNNLNKSFFDEHVIVSRTSLNMWDEGISFRVCYRLTVGWAIAYTCDSFIILVSENSNRISSLPRNTLLSRDQIEMVIDNRAFSSDIDTVSGGIELRFETLDRALDTLISRSQVNKLCSGRIFINDKNGNLTMEAHGQYEDEINSCIQGTIDLMTGTTESMDTPCWIN